MGRAFETWWTLLGCGKLESEQIVVVREELLCCEVMSIGLSNSRPSQAFLTTARDSPANKPTTNGQCRQVPRGSRKPTRPAVDS
jgi:hypothetical protein